MARAKKTVVNGITFDSKTESDFYKVLLDRQDREEISNLTTQPSFELFPSFKLRKRTVRSMNYTPDFMYSIGTERHVVEVKGYSRPEYLMRRKIFLWMYGDDCIFHEVKRKGKGFSDKVW